MKPSCPKCGCDMSLAARLRRDIPSARTTFCCEPCSYVFNEVDASEAESSAIVERAMLLDLQASIHFGAMH